MSFQELVGFLELTVTYGAVHYLSALILVSFTFFFPPKKTLLVVADSLGGLYNYQFAQRALSSGLASIPTVWTCIEIHTNNYTY